MRSLPIIILAIMIFSITSVYAIRESIVNDQGYIVVYPDNPEMAADYKLNYAIMYSESELVKSKILINDYDIDWARKSLEWAQKSCIELDGPHCDDAKDYQNALVKLANVQSQQTGNPPASIPSSSSADGGKKKSGALSQLSAWAKWLNNLADSVIRALKGFI